MECAVGQNSTLQLVHTFFILLPIPTGAWSSLIIGIILLGLAWRLQSDRSFREKKYVKQGKWINYTFFLRYCNVVTSIGKAVRIYILISLLAVYNWQIHVRLLIIQNTSVQIYIWISIIWNSSSYVTRAEDPRLFLSFDSLFHLQCVQLYLFLTYIHALTHFLASLSSGSDNSTCSP